MDYPTPSSSEELFLRVRALRGLVIEVLGDEHAAEDVLQEVWLAHQAKHRGPESRGWGWLRGLARIEVLRRRRRDRRRSARERIAARPEAEPAEASFDASERIELARVVLAEVQALPEADARVLWMHYFEERSMAEIAHASEVSLEAVRSRLFRARQRLRERLERRFGSGAEWRSALAPLLGTTETSVGIGAAAGGMVAITGGVAVKGKILGATLLLALLGSATWIAWRKLPHPDPPATPLAVAVAEAPSEATRESTQRALADRPFETAREGAMQDTAQPAEVRGPGILVLDSHGTPRAGVPVQILRRASFGMNRQWSGTTAEGGFAPFPANLAERIEPMEGEQIVATFDFPLASPSEVALDEDAIPEEPIVLHLPETGSAELHFVDENGAEPELDLSVACRGGPRERLENDPELWNLLQQRTFRPSSARLVLPFLGLGCELEVRAHWPQIDRRNVWRRFRGPTQRGEHLVLDVLAGPRVPYLTGRILDANGSPVADSFVSVRFEETDGARFTGGGSAIHTDTAGHFRLGLWSKDAPLDTGKLRLSFVGREALDQAEGEVEIAMPLPNGAVDLGDIVLVQPPIVTAGIVRDRAGRPLPATVVSIALHRPGVRNYEKSTARQTDDQGRFVHRAAASESNLVVSLSLDMRSVVERWDLVPGSPEAMNLELVMPERTGLAGSALLDPELALPIVHVRAIDAHGVQRAIPLRSRTEEFVLTLPAGAHRVLVDASGLESLREEDIVAQGLILLDLPEVRVEEGGLTRDPRLQGIDLRGRWRELRAVLLDPRGTPLRRRDLLLAPTGATDARGAYVARTDHEGRFSRLVLREHGSFLLGLAGYRVQTISWEPLEQKLRLRDGLEVSLRLRDGAPRVEPPFVLVAMLRPKKLSTPDELRAVGTNTDFLGEIEGDRCTIRVPSPGSYKVHWFLRLRRGSSYSATGANVPEDPRVDVRDLPGPQEFEVAPHASAVEAARRQLSRER